MTENYAGVDTSAVASLSKVTAFLVTLSETILMKLNSQHAVLTRRVHDNYFNVRLLDAITVDDKYIFIINALINTLRARLIDDEFLEIQIVGYDETGFPEFLVDMPLSKVQDFYPLLERYKQQALGSNT